MFEIGSFIAAVITVAASILATIFFLDYFKDPESAREIERRLHQSEISNMKKDAELVDRDTQLKDIEVKEKHKTFVTQFVKDSYYKTQDKITEVKKEAKKKAAASLKKSKEVMKGNAYEQLVPFIDGLGYNPNDLVFVGGPIDYIGFKGKSEEEITEIVIIEVKTGDSRLNNRQKQIKKLITSINDKRLKWKEYRITTKPTVINHDKKLAKNNQCLCPKCCDL